MSCTTTYGRRTEETLLSHLCTQDDVLRGSSGVPLDPVAGVIPPPLEVLRVADVQAERDFVVDRDYVRESPSAPVGSVEL